MVHCCLLGREADLKNPSQSRWGGCGGRVLAKLWRLKGGKPKLCSIGRHGEKKRGSGKGKKCRGHVRGMAVQSPDDMKLGVVEYDW